MTSNDAQIDVLLRRYAGQSQTAVAGEHLDADELNAFAEGSLPAAARSRYLSHLIDCDNCRQIVSQLAISSGALIKTESESATDAQGHSWWKRLSGFFSPLTLTSAALAAVLIVIAGVGFFVMRQRAEPTLIAQRDQSKNAPESAVKPAGDQIPQTSSAPQSGGVEKKQEPFTSSSTSQASPGPDEIAKLDKAAEKPPVLSRSAREAEAPPPPATATATAKKAEAGEAQISPSYAPPPPLEGQRAETSSRAEQSPKSIASVSGPRKGAPTDSFKMEDRARAAESEKDSRGGSDSSLVMNQPSASRRAGVDKAKGPRRDAENNVRNSNSNEVPIDATKAQGVVTTNRASAEEKPPETRSAGGRKFRRQGNAWVDAKFKTSMNLKSISRGSSDFTNLDSGLRSIAQELSGELIVVWKGKAYLIR